MSYHVHFNPGKSNKLPASQCISLFAILILSDEATYMATPRLKVARVLSKKLSISVYSPATQEPSLDMSWPLLLECCGLLKAEQVSSWDGRAVNQIRDQTCNGAVWQLLNGGQLQRCGRWYRAPPVIFLLVKVLSHLNSVTLVEGCNGNESLQEWCLLVNAAKWAKCNKTRTNSWQSLEKPRLPQNGQNRLQICKQAGDGEKHKIQETPFPIPIHKLGNNRDIFCEICSCVIQQKYNICKQAVRWYLVCNILQQRFLVRCWLKGSSNNLFNKVEKLATTFNLVWPQTWHVSLRPFSCFQVTHAVQNSGKLGIVIQTKNLRTLLAGRYESWECPRESLRFQLQYITLVCLPLRCLNCKKQDHGKDVLNLHNTPSKPRVQQCG